MMPSTAERAIGLLTFPALSIERGRVPATEGQLHTNWTDGCDDIETMYAAGHRAGLTAMLYSEHTRLGSADWFPDFARTVRALSSAANNPRAFVGTEVRVLTFDGDLDLDPIVASESSVVLASVHRFPDPAGKPKAFEETDPKSAIALEKRLMLAAVKHADVDVLSHPFGMSLIRFGQTVSEEDWLEVIEATRSKDVAFEINSKYHADPARLLGLCMQVGARISLGSDAHDESAVGNCYRLLTSQLEGERP